MKPQMTVSYTVERPRGGQTLHLAGQGGRAGPYRGHIEPRAAQLHLSHGIVFSEDRQGLRPAHFRMQRQQRGCGTLPVGLLFRLRSAGGPAVVEVLEEVLDRRARPCRALADRHRCCPCPRLCQWYAAPETSPPSNRCATCASSRRCMTAPAPWLPRWGNSCVPAGAASCGC